MEIQLIYLQLIYANNILILIVMFLFLPTFFFCLLLFFFILLCIVKILPPAMLKKTLKIFFRDLSVCLIKLLTLKNAQIIRPCLQVPF